MTDLTVASTVRTPKISFSVNGNFDITGISMPDNAYEFYIGVLDWVKEYAKDPKPETFFSVKLRYLNSSSSSMMFKLFSELNTMQNEGKTVVQCNWYCEEDDTSMQDFVDAVKEFSPNVEIKTTEIQSVFGISA